MNWKDYAYLFCNGKFRVRVKDRNAEYVNALITAYSPQVNKISALTNQFQSHSVPFKVKDCTLIARPISDMTAEEFQKDPSGRVWNQVSNTAESFMYLLSIGVLPKQFEKGFKDGTVINTNSIKER